MNPENEVPSEPVERFALDSMNGTVDEDPDGEFVKYEALSALRASWEKEKARLQDHLDLMVDEFMRIKAISNSEIQGLCERAITTTKQHIPVIEQRDILQNGLDSMRAEKQALEAEKYDLLTYGANQAETIVRLEAEKQALEERVKELESVPSSMMVVSKGKFSDMEKENACLPDLRLENGRLKAENAELKETLQGNICAYCLKHEVEDCPHNPNKRVLETGPAGEGRAFLKETTTIEKLQAERDSLTCALAEAREALERIADGDVGQGGFDPVYAEFARKALSNPTSQRASEEMMGLRKVVQEARKSCACGARGESLDTHPHVGGCELGKAFEDYDKNRGAV